MKFVYHEGTGTYIGADECVLVNLPFTDPDEVDSFFTDLANDDIPPEFLESI